MILVDADIILLDKRYTSDPRFDVNRRLLDRLSSGKRVVGIATQALLEVAGVMSFNLRPAHLSDSPLNFAREYHLRVVPSIRKHPEYAACSFAVVSKYIAKRMSLGDAVQAAQIEKYAPNAEVLLTWNSRHFVNKVPIPVQTPAEWLAVNP